MEVVRLSHGIFQRCLFLETIAGIPGMVAATIRHLHSLRLLVSYLSDGSLRMS